MMDQERIDKVAAEMFRIFREDMGMTVHHLDESAAQEQQIWRRLARTALMDALDTLRGDLGDRDARGTTAIEIEFVGGRLATAQAAAAYGLPDAMWAMRYLQDVPPLLREILALRRGQGLVWQDGKPAQTGEYWILIEDRDPEIWDLWVSNDGRLRSTMIDDCDVFIDEEPIVRFAGPIPEPREPSEYSPNNSERISGERLVEQIVAIREAAVTEGVGPTVGAAIARAEIVAGARGT